MRHRQGKCDEVFWLILDSTIFELSLKTHTHSMALSPRANYTDWSTATCRRNLVSIFVDRGVSRGQRGGSRTVVNLSFLNPIFSKSTKKIKKCHKCKTLTVGDRKKVIFCYKLASVHFLKIVSPNCYPFMPFYFFCFIVNPQDRGDMFLRNVNWHSTDYFVWLYYPRK
jgi:hypothetical protein